MSVVARNLRRFARALQAVPAGDVLAKVYDRWSHLLVVRDHGKGAPSYREGEDGEVYKTTLDTTTLPDAPNTTAPASGTYFNIEAFGGICLYWRASAVDGATHTDIDLSVWALADNGDWLQIATEAALLPYVELSVPGTGYRRVFVQVTDTNGGAAGNIDLIAAGD